MIDSFWRNQAPEPDNILNWGRQPILSCLIKELAGKSFLSLPPTFWLSILRSGKFFRGSLQDDSARISRHCLPYSREHLLPQALFDGIGL